MASFGYLLPVVAFGAVLSHYVVAMNAHLHKYNCTVAAHCNQAKLKTKVKTSFKISQFSLVFINCMSAWTTLLRYS